MQKKNIKEIQNRIEEITGYLEEHEKKVEKEKKELSKLTKQRIKLFIDNKMYCPISKLKKYADKDINSIRIVLDNGSITLYNYGDFIEIDENGYFYYSDDNNGIVAFDETNNKYYSSYWGRTQELNIVGFYDLIIDNKIIKETQFEELIRNAK